MITLRNFDAGDCDFLITQYKPGMTESEALALIDEWKQKSYKGSYFEVFAICSDSLLVGWILLYAPPHEDSTISAGPEIIEQEQRKGYCYQAMQLVMEYAKTMGYKTATAQVRKNNIPSIRLHEKCGFVVTGECVTSRGNEAFWYRMEL